MQPIVVNESGNDLLGIIAYDSGMEQQMQQLFSRWGRLRKTVLNSSYTMT